MADERDERDNQEHTDLIDVSDIATEFDEGLTPLPGEGSADEPLAALEPRHELAGDHSPAIASLQDRFVATGIDTALLFLFYWILALLYRKVAFGIAAGPVPAAGWHGLSFHAMFIGFALLYYLLFEGLAGRQRQAAVAGG